MSGWIKSLGKDSLVYGIGYGVTRFLQIIILPIIAGALTISEFGYYSNYVIFYSFTGGLFIFGLDSAVPRYFYDSEDTTYHQKLFSSALYFILLISLVSVIVLYFFPATLLNILNIPYTYKDALPYVLLCIPALALNGYFLTWFKWRRQKIYFLINSGGTVILLLLPLLFFSSVTFIYIFKVLFWSQLVVSFISAILASNYIRPYFSFKLLGTLLKYGFPWLLVFLFGASRSYLDRVFLTRYLSDEIYGLYNFSIRISTLISLVITAFDMSFGPLAFSIWNKEGAQVFFAKLQSLYTFLISSIACVITILSPLIIRLLGGEKYEGAENILPILLFAAIPLSLINFSNLGTAYAKKSFLSTLSLFIGFITVLILNLFLTRHFLQYGATSASLVGHLFIIITGYYFSHKYYKIPFSYAKDAFIFLFFFIFSLLSVHFQLSNEFYLNMVFQLFTLVMVGGFLFLRLFPGQYKKILYY